MQTLHTARALRGGWLVMRSAFQLMAVVHVTLPQSCVARCVTSIWTRIMQHIHGHVEKLRLRLRFCLITLKKNKKEPVRLSSIMRAFLFYRIVMYWSISITDTILVFNLARGVCVFRSYLNNLVTFIRKQNLLTETK